MKNFIITGIGMRNKGSQAMFLALHHGLRRACPGCNITGFATPSKDAATYKFKLLPWDYQTRRLFHGRLHRVPGLVGLLRLARRCKATAGHVRDIDATLREADAVFDASGYSLGSGWNKRHGYGLLYTVRLAKRYEKPIILMPQSFGPFDWGEPDDEKFIQAVREDLMYPKAMFSREKEGYACLQELDLANVRLSADMVLREREFPTAADVFVSERQTDIDHIEQGSVGVVINENVFRVGASEEATSLYAQAIDRLVDSGEVVYVLRTSSRDIDYIRRVMEQVHKPQCVRIIQEEYSSPELIEVIRRFKYIIASRYHSIVFAYRSSVPAVMLGWSAKYHDLAELLGQEEYVADIRTLGARGILEMIDRMRSRHREESLCIKEHLGSVQGTSVVQEALGVLGYHDDSESERTCSRQMAAQK